MVNALLTAVRGSKAFMTADGETSPIFVAETTDPLYGVNGADGLNGEQISVPSNAQPGSGSDHPLIVLDPVTQAEARFWQASVSHG